MGVVVCWLRGKALPRVLVEADVRLLIVAVDWAKMLGAHPEITLLRAVVVLSQVRLHAGGLQLLCLQT